MCDIYFSIRVFLSQYKEKFCFILSDTLTKLLRETKHSNLFGNVDSFSRVAWSQGKNGKEDGEETDGKSGRMPRGR